MEKSRRLFVAVDLPPDVRAALARLARELPGRRTPEEQLHVTVRFFPAVAPEPFDLLRRALARAAVPAFECRAAGVGAFPPRRAPRVVWAGLDPREPFRRLEDAISGALEDAGFPRETRPFSPHVTLARLRDARPGEARGFLERHAGFSAGPFPVAEFVLYESELTPSGARHTPVERYPLG